MSLAKSAFCAGCGKKEFKNEEYELKACTRCRAVKYCGRNCQRNDFKKHDSLCQSIKKVQDELTKIEGTFKKFKLSDGSSPQNIFETQIGDFWNYTNSQHGDDKDRPVWPQEYLKKRKEMVDVLWQIADTNAGNNYDATQMILDNCVEMLRLDASNSLDYTHMIAFAFLILGKDQDAYDFVKYWINLEDEPEKEEYQALKPGEWLKMSSGQDRFENLIEDEDLQAQELAYKLAYLAIKIRNVNELEEDKAKVERFDKKLSDAKPDTLTAEIKNYPLIVDLAHLFIMGNEKRHEESLKEQKLQIDHILDEIDAENGVILPALLAPKPLLNRKEPDSEKAYGEAYGAYKLLKFTWRYFHRLNGAKKMIQDHLYPDHEEGTPFPEYDCEIYSA